MTTYDLFTIGAGSGGVRASRFAANMGAKVAIAEGRFFGGTCVNVGCVPKKLMVYAAHFREDFHDALGFGWNVEAPTFDWAKFLHKKDEEIKRLNHIYRKLLHNANVDIAEGYARLLDPHTIEVTHPNQQRTTYQAKNILIATGGKPQRPEIPGAEHCLISDDMFRLEKLPRKAVVVGGGYIAVEFAGILHGLGVEVSLVHRGDRILKSFDEELCQFLTREIQKKGISIHLSSSITHVEKHGERLQVFLKGQPTLEVDAVLFATGRTPNTDSLGLAALGVTLGAHGEIVVDADLKTNIPNIFAIGDVINRVNLTPVALAEGMAVANHLFGKGAKPLDYQSIATAVFSQPPLATVGVSEAKARELYGEVEVFASEFTPMKHTLSGNTERTFMKLLVAKESRKVVGVHMVGADSPEIIQMAAIALQCGATKEHFDATIGIHPTAAEELVTMRTRRS